MDESRGPWENAVDAAMNYMVATRNITTWLREIGTEFDEPEEEPDFSELEKMIEERDHLAESLRAVDMSKLPEEPADERERMNRDITRDMLRQIASLDEENREMMDILARKYREKQRTLRQKREQLETYGKQQVYGQGLSPEMMAGSYFNQAN